jgi:hypothetical protein
VIGAAALRVLRKHGYPPDKEDRATQTVLSQAEVIARGWAAWADAGTQSSDDVPGPTRSVVPL